MYASPNTVAYLLDMAPSSIRELLDDPRSGLSAHIRTVRDNDLEALSRQDVAKSYGTRIALWDVARYVARRRRASKWDQSKTKEPTKAEIRTIWWQMVAAAAVYRLLKATLKKFGRGAEAQLRKGIQNVIE